MNNDLGKKNPPYLLLTLYYRSFSRHKPIQGKCFLASYWLSLWSFQTIFKKRGRFCTLRLRIDRSKRENAAEPYEHFSRTLLRFLIPILLEMQTTYWRIYHVTMTRWTLPEYVHNERAVGRSPKNIGKKPARRILKNINWYSSYESSKTGECNTFLVFFIIPLSWP